MLERNVLTEAIRRMGPADVFVGDPLVANGMVNIGKLEGERRAEIEYSDNRLTLPEYTGDIPHDVMANISAARIVCSIILNTAGVDTYQRINPLGSTAFGNSNFQEKPTFGVVLVPHRELGKQLLYNTDQNRWERTNDDDTIEIVDAAPVYALWLWKAHVMHGSIPFGFENGGKSLVEVTFEGMFDETKPEGAKVGLLGDPWAFSTPIEVFGVPS